MNNFYQRDSYFWECIEMKNDQFMHMESYAYEEAHYLIAKLYDS